MGAEKINLDELRKARQELNQERGIVEPPKPEKKFSENTDSSKIENINADKFSDAQKPQSNENVSNLKEDEPYINNSSERNYKNNEEDIKSKIEKISENVEEDAQIQEAEQMNQYDDVLSSVVNSDSSADTNATEISSPNNEAKTNLNINEPVPIKINKELPKIQENNNQNAVYSVKPIEKTAISPQKSANSNTKNDNLDRNTAKMAADTELKPIIIPNVDISPKNNQGKKAESSEENKVSKPLESELELNKKPETDEQALPQNGEANEETTNGEHNNDEVNEDALPKIEDAKFINLIKSKSFMGTDNLTCIFGTDEKNNVFCQNIKDFYNTAIFCYRDENVFELFSSIIMSLLLKNSKFDIKFALCDAKIGGALSVYNSLSYMYFDRIAESNREIIDALKNICHEIDERYKSLAKTGVNSVEKFNSEMKKAKVAPLPYLILMFNNYTRAYHLDDSNEINSNLSYILRFGRLVGVYVYLVSFDENLPENINFNLQTRIAYKTDLKEASISELGEEGAENIGYEDEFIVKTLYSDKLIHLKAPKISQKEIELLIKNIEKK